jgi:5'-nucleotidase/UDP-sugar diphosphatase
MLITRRVATGLLLVPLGGIRFAGAQPPPHTAQVTFVLVNDIYLMSDTLMPDGKRRGGFARLAAVVKAERARAKAAGGSVIFAHAGDTLSPSLMSSLDQGASIVTLTNMVAPDIFTPGNHEYDFGKAVFLERMAAATFPRYGVRSGRPQIPAVGGDAHHTGAGTAGRGRRLRGRGRACHPRAGL